MSGAVAVCSLSGALIVGCISAQRAPRAVRPSVAPHQRGLAGESIKLAPGAIEPMYREKLAIDLATALQVAAAQNLDIRQARQQVEAAQGRLESAVGAAFPAIVPTALFEHVEGTVRATEGNLVGVGFNTFQPSIAAQWILNPPRVAYDILAARKRLSASEQLEQVVQVETLRATATQYYDLVLAQTRVSAAQQGVTEAEELLRITRLRLQAGTGVPADDLRAAARLAERRQELIAAVNAFYNASVALATTLRLEPTLTLVPMADALPPVTLVRDDLDLDDLLGLAVAYRPDLERVRALVEAAAADRGATWWGAFGPQFQVSYHIGGITGHANHVDKGQGIPGNLIVNPLSPNNGSFSTNPLANGLIRENLVRGSRALDPDRDHTFGFSDQQRFTASAGWRWSVSAFGDLKASSAAEKQALIEAERRLDQIKAQVVMAKQASQAGGLAIPLAHEQVTAAEEGLRLSEANLRVGTMTTLDVLVAQASVMRARLSYAAAVVRYNQAQVALLAAIGLLDETATVMNAQSGKPNE